MKDLEMYNNFEKELEEIQKITNLAWYEIFDGENFKLVEKAIAIKYFNNDIKAMQNNLIYKNWVNEMTWNL